MTTYLTTADVAQRIGMSVDYVSRQCASGALKAKKLGTEWRIPEHAVDEFMGATDPAPAARKRLSARQLRRTG